MEHPPNHVVRVSVEEGFLIVAHPERCAGPLGCGLLSWMALLPLTANRVHPMGGLSTIDRDQPHPVRGFPVYYEVLPECQPTGTWGLKALGVGDIAP